MPVLNNIELKIINHANKIFDFNEKLWWKLQYKLALIEHDLYDVYSIPIVNHALLNDKELKNLILDS